MTSYQKPKRTTPTLKVRGHAGDPMRARFVHVIERLKPGEVVCYQEVAERAGYPNRQRAVGQLLSISLDALPWWRVVYASGHLPPCNPSLQESLLVEEGVELKGFRVVRAPLGRFTAQ